MTSIFYDRLASWWPLISPVEDYAEEAAYVAGLLAGGDPPVRTVLELGCGGGHLTHHFKDRFELTLTDISTAMLARSQAVNPSCQHAQGDMRSLRLGRT